MQALKNHWLNLHQGNDLHLVALHLRPGFADDFLGVLCVFFPFCCESILRTEELNVLSQHVVFEFLVILGLLIRERCHLISKVFDALGKLRHMLLLVLLQITKVILDSLLNYVESILNNTYGFLLLLYFDLHLF